jgi:hypothetical protein
MKLRHLGAVAVALAACGCMKAADSKAGDQVAAHFYDQVAAKQYEAIFQESAPELRNSTTTDVFVGMMARLDRKLGACGKPAKTMNWRVNVTTNGTLRDQGYERVCANGKLAESITTITRDGKTLLAGYHANSPLLLTD